LSTQRSALLSRVQVLVTPVGRLKVSGLGVSEALAGEVVPSGADDLLQLQRDDVAVSAACSGVRGDQLHSCVQHAPHAAAAQSTASLHACSVAV
jgi:hypothetical protein